MGVNISFWDFSFSHIWEPSVWFVKCNPWGQGFTSVVHHWRLTEVHFPRVLQYTLLASSLIFWQTLTICATVAHILDLVNIISKWRSYLRTSSIQFGLSNPAESCMTPESLSLLSLRSSSFTHREPELITFARTLPLFFVRLQPHSLWQKNKGPWVSKTT